VIIRSGMGQPYAGPRLPGCPTTPNLLTVLVLLPPSEGKATARRRGPAVAVDRLSFPALGPAREQLLDLLIEASGRPDAQHRLGVGDSVLGAVAANVHLRRTPAMTAGAVFTGVLYDALDLAGLDPAARRRAARQVVVSSALWGALRLGDRIPPYRLGITADLPGIGPLATWWRPRLEQSMREAAGSGVIVDCRSAGYAAMWSPPTAQSGRWVTVRVLREVAGRRSVVSHLAKLTRGQLTRHLLSSSSAPRTPRQVAEIADQVFAVELTEPPRPGRPWTLDVVLREG
jgi:cytoplasmic iron level regulating protein YaaA (DUF328/UPF0246 family)